MAKKGQAIQLQAEINTDEDWEKLLQRDGLIVVDVYSEWCGPCSGMAATLKKLKLEIGGDVLQLAVAKADRITALERFRNKSEPTWMFIVNGKLVNFMFGANAPKLTRIITEELKKENEAREGRRERVLYEISDLTDEEKERLSVIESVARAAREKEEEKAAKELYDRRTAECHNILETLNHLGVILIFPHARTAYQEAFGDLLGEAGLTINQTEKFQITEQILQELFYFTENPFPEESIEELLGDISIILLVKPMPAREVEEPTDQLLLRIVYGDMKKPPGSPDSSARTLSKLPLKPEEEKEGEEEEEVHKEQHDFIAIWTPEDEQTKATALRLFFHKLTESHLIPEPEPVPPHYAVIFEAIRRREISELMEKYPNEILRYGFFTSDVPEEAKLVAKTIKKYERCPDRTPNEKMVIQLAKRKSECTLAFAQLKPLYISANAKEGKRECQIFFPDDYDEPIEEEEEEEEVAPPPKKKGKAKPKTEEGVEGEGEEATHEGEETEEEAEEAEGEAEAEGAGAELGKGEAVEGQELPPEGQGEAGEGGEAPPVEELASEVAETTDEESLA